MQNFTTPQASYFELGHTAGYTAGYTDGYTQACKDQVEELQKLIEDWINSNTNISEFYRVIGNSREKKITQEEFEDYKE